MIYIWALVAAFFVIILELQAAKGIPYRELWYILIPSSIMINFSIYQMILLAPNLISAFIVFSAVTFAGRLAVTMFLGQQLSGVIWVTVVLYAIILVLREAERHL